jgi:hypothetical protein
LSGTIHIKLAQPISLDEWLQLCDRERIEHDTRANSPYIFRKGFTVYWYGAYKKPQDQRWPWKAQRDLPAQANSLYVRVKYVRESADAARIAMQIVSTYGGEVNYSKGFERIWESIATGEQQAIPVIAELPERVQPFALVGG